METDFMWLVNSVLGQLDTHKNELYVVAGVLGFFVFFVKHFKLYVDDNAVMLFTRKLLERLNKGLNQPVEKRVSPIESLGTLGVLPISFALDLAMFFIPGVAIKVQRKIRCKTCKVVISPQPDRSEHDLPHFCNTCVYVISKALNEHSVVGSNISRNTRNIGNLYTEMEKKHDDKAVRVSCRSCSRNDVGDNGKLYIKDGFLHGVCQTCWEQKYYAKSK